MTNLNKKISTILLITMLIISNVSIVFADPSISDKYFSDDFRDDTLNSNLPSTYTVTTSGNTTYNYARIATNTYRDFNFLRLNADVNGSTKVSISVDLTYTDAITMYVLPMGPGSAGLQQISIDNDVKQYWHATNSDQSNFTTVTYDTTSYTGTHTLSFYVSKNGGDGNSSRLYVAYYGSRLSVTTAADPPLGGSMASTNDGFGIYNMPYTVSCTANSPYVFYSWSDGSLDNPYTFNLMDNTNLTATFVLSSYTVSTSVNPSGSGSVTGGGEYQYNQECTLTAIPNTGYVFDSWSDGSTLNPRSFNVRNSISLTANFIQSAATTYTISTSVNPSGSGSVTGGGTYNDGTFITLEAIPEEGYVFKNWSDGVLTNPRSLTVNSNQTYIAYFEEEQSEYTVTLNVHPEGYGTVTGSGIYDSGEVIQISADAEEGYEFVSWSDGSIANPRDISVNSNINLTANFRIISEPVHNDEQLTMIILLISFLILLSFGKGVNYD